MYIGACYTNNNNLLAGWLLSELSWRTTIVGCTGVSDNSGCHLREVLLDDEGQIEAGREKSVAVEDQKLGGVHDGFGRLTEQHALRQALAEGEDLHGGPVGQPGRGCAVVEQDQGLVDGETWPT